MLVQVHRDLLDHSETLQAPARRPSSLRHIPDQPELHRLQMESNGLLSKLD